jgi:hypothetical protein
VSAALHLAALEAFWPLRTTPPSFVEPEVVEVAIVPPPHWVAPTVHREAALRPHWSTRGAATSGLGALSPAPGPIAPTSPEPLIEDRWRVSQALWAEETTKAALRRAQAARLCFGELDGVLSADEKALCERFWSGSGVRRRSGSD